MDIEKIFAALGGTFLTPPAKIAESLSKVSTLIFDWDGVFNNGMKWGDAGSSFSEVDSMGINMLRFSLWLKTGKMPFCFIITGMNNQAAAGFAKREHFDGIVMNLKRKKVGLDLVCNSYGIDPAEIAFLWDDVIDVEMARVCGLSMYVSKRSNPLFRNFVLTNKICDYMTASSGDSHGIREVCELLIGLNGNFDAVMEKRINFSAEYEKYLNLRDQKITQTEFHR